MWNYVQNVVFVNGMLFGIRAGMIVSVEELVTAAQESVRVIFIR